jgi:hypothetical protein
MSFEVALALGAHIARDERDYLRMRRSGRYLLIRAREDGRPWFWELVPELIAIGSSRTAKQ